MMKNVVQKWLPIMQRLTFDVHSRISAQKCMKWLYLLIACNEPGQKLVARLGLLQSLQINKGL